MTQTPTSAAEQLPAGFNGEVLSDGDAGYDAARSVWNGEIDLRPALIARCGDAADVVAAIAFGRDRNLEIAVRGGGHNFGGSAWAKAVR
jgi:FAD/FMN-containing dehydrogenase